MSAEQLIHLKETKDLLARCREQGKLTGEQCFILCEARVDPKVFQALSSEDQKYLIRIMGRCNETARVLADVFFG